MFYLQVVEKPWFIFSQDTLDEISKNISKIEKKQQKWILNIAFTSDESIQNLNKNYRNIDRVTDVLSFHYYEDFWSLRDEDLAGEIVLSENRVISQWEEYGLGTEKEFYKLIIHSVLHILWYDHETDEEYEEMRKLEDAVWSEIFEE